MALTILPYKMIFGYPIEFRVSAGLVLVMDFHPNRFRVRVRVSGSGFGFGCTEIPPDPNPTRCHPYRPLADNPPGASVSRGWPARGLLRSLVVDIARRAAPAMRAAEAEPSRHEPRQTNPTS